MGLLQKILLSGCCWTTIIIYVQCSVCVFALKMYKTIVYSISKLGRTLHIFNVVTEYFVVVFYLSIACFPHCFPP